MAMVIRDITKYYTKNLHLKFINIMLCQWACKIAIFQKYNLAQKSLIEFIMYSHQIAVMFEKDTKDTKDTNIYASIQK